MHNLNHTQICGSGRDNSRPKAQEKGYIRCAKVLQKRLPQEKTTPTTPCSFPTVGRPALRAGARRWPMRDAQPHKHTIHHQLHSTMPLKAERLRAASLRCSTVRTGSAVKPDKTKEMLVRWYHIPPLPLERLMVLNTATLSTPLSSMSVDYNEMLQLSLLSSSISVFPSELSKSMFIYS